MRPYMYIPQGEHKGVLYLFVLQCLQDQLREWRLEEGCPREFQGQAGRGSWHAIQIGPARMYKLNLPDETKQPSFPGMSRKESFGWSSLAAWSLPSL